MESPWPILRLTDSDTGTGKDQRVIHGACRTFDDQTSLIEGAAIHGQIDLQGLADLPGTGTQVQRRPASPALSDPLQARVGLQRSDQDSSRSSLGLRDQVQEQVDSVGAIDVDASWRAEERRVPLGLPSKCMTSRIIRTVCLSLDDRAPGPLQIESTTQ